MMQPTRTLEPLVRRDSGREDLTDAYWLLPLVQDRRIFPSTRLERPSNPVACVHRLAQTDDCRARLQLIGRRRPLSLGVPASA